MACGCGKSIQKAQGRSPGLRSLNLSPSEEYSLMTQAGLVQIEYMGVNKAPVTYVLKSGARIKASAASLHKTAWVSEADATALLGTLAGGSFRLVEAAPADEAQTDGGSGAGTAEGPADVPQVTGSYEALGLPEGYDAMTVEAVTSWALTADKPSLMAALDYEEGHKGRRGALEAMDRALDKLEAEGG